MKSLVSLTLLVLVGACSDSNFKGTVPEAMPKVVVSTGENAIPAAPEPAAVVPTEEEVATPIPAAKPDPTVVVDTKDDALPSSPADCVKDAAKIALKVVPVHFDARSETCKWSAGGNFAKVNATLTSREASTKSVELPEGTVCTMQMKTQPSAKFWYDDMLILTLDKTNILATSTKTIVESGYLGAANAGVYAWDWSKIGNRPAVEPTFFFHDKHPYCLGTASENCSIPLTDTEGPIDLKFDKNAFAPITASIFAKKSVDLDLIVTGDDDDTDCKHSALDIDVTFGYIPK